MALLSPDTNYFGLDIGSTALKLVQLKKTGSNPALVTYGSVEMPPGMAMSDAHSNQESLASLIRQLVKDTGVSTNHVVVGLSASNLFASVITTPKLSGAELSKGIKYQADQYIPMSLDQVKLDWAVVGPGKSENEQEVLLVAAPNTAAEKYASIMELAGLEIVALEANATALIRSLVRDKSKAVFVLDIGQYSSELAISYNGNPYLIRSVNIGGGTFIKAVAQNLKLDDTQAQQFTYRFGLTSAKLEGEVLKSLKPSVDSLISEVDKSSKYFLGRYPGVKLEKIIITGSTTKLPELPKYLANATGLPVELGNAWGQVSYPSGQQDTLMSVADQYAVAVGLAQRSMLA
jgi:type IV pilus assembly protein PilM